MAGTNAWVSNWLAQNCRSSSRRCSGGFPRCGWRCRSKRFRSSMTTCRTGSTNCPSRGDHSAFEERSMMSTQPTATLYPPEGFGAPKNRQAHARGLDVGLPAGTEVFSADNHISVADDIFYERFPDDLKERAPRIWYEDGAYMVGLKGRNFLPGDFSRVLMQYDDMAGAATKDIEARIQELHDDGV